MEFQTKNNRALRGLAVLLILLLSSVGRADWAATPGSVKVYIKKRASIPAIGQTASTAPPETLAKWDAAIVDERENYLIVQVPSSKAAGLRSDLLPIVDSVQIRNDFDVLDFLAARVDARLPETAYPAPWDRTTPLPSPGRDAFVVQFAATPRATWLADLRATGATIIDYIPQNGYAVLASGAALSGFAQHHPVQLVRLHKPFHKISVKARASSDPFTDIVAAVARVPEATDPRAFLQANSLSAIRPVENAGDREFHTVTIATSALPQLAAFPAVIWVETYKAPVPSGEREAKLVAGDTQVSNSGGVLKPVTGDYRSWLVNKGVRTTSVPPSSTDYRNATRVAILDTGFDTGAYPDPNDVQKDFRRESDNTSFVDVVNYTNGTDGNQDCNEHGSFVAGTLAGNAGTANSTPTKDNGSQYPGDADFLMGLGVVPEMPLTVGRVFNFLASSTRPLFDPQAWTTIYADLLSRGVGITSNSWNDTGNTSYGTIAQTFDRLVRSASGVNYGAPMAIYVAAGNNEGTGQLPPYVNVEEPATAKNVVSVGGNENFNLNTYTLPALSPQNMNGPYSDNGNDMWHNSAIGPTVADGRIKPDLVAPATAMESPKTRDTSTCRRDPIGSVIDSSQEHIWSRGTSFSSPAAAGSGALLYTWFQNKGLGAPKPSLLKAMQINFAYDLTGTNVTGSAIGRPPDTNQGWGKADLTRAFMTDARYDWANEESNTLITSSGSSVYFPSIVGTYTIKDTSKPVRITLVWTDQFASTLTGTALVNDLNLKVWMATGGEYALGDDFNTTTGRSNIHTSGGTPNAKDNVEQVVFTYADVGTTHFVVEVNGYAINGDAIDVWTAPPYTPQQDFAIFIDNVVGR